MTDIVVKELTKRYPNGFEAVKQLSLEIGEAELLVLVGPSGCGKRTALRMIAGLEDITSGDLYIGGRRMNDVSEKDRDIADGLPELCALPAHDRRAEHRLQPEADEDAEERDPGAGAGDGAAARDRAAPRPPAKQLSGGQRQRVAMGRAVIRQPQVYLMDEPLSNLDGQLRVHMRGEIEGLQKRLGVTTVYVTHDQVEAMTMGDRVAVLRDGVLQQVDTPTNIYDRPANLFVAGFIGSPPMNFAQAKIESHDGLFEVRLGDQTVTIPPEVAKAKGLAAWEGREVIAGVRPEDLVPAHEGANGSRLRGRVERVEELGAEVLVYFAVNAPGPKGGSVVAARIGDTVEAVLDTRRLHFFDPETDAAL